MQLPQLYPLTFEPYLKKVIWGGNRIAAYKGVECSESAIGESWEISALEGHETVVAEGPLKGKTLNDLIEIYGDDLVGAVSMKHFGRRFPLLFKFLDTKGDLSVQVHPDEETAIRLGYDHGKYEFSYIIDAEPEAIFYNGFKGNVSHEEALAVMESDNILSDLQGFSSRRGDAQYVPAGRVHAIGRGHLIAEVQQASDVTFRIYDYNRLDKNGCKRNLHTALAREAVKTGNKETLVEYRRELPVATFDMCPWFVINLLEVARGKMVELPPHRESFMVIMALEGEVILLDGTNRKILKKGHTILLPASIKNLMLTGQGKVLTTHLPENLP